MVVQIRGGGFSNKGAYMMLRTALDWVRTTQLGARAAVGIRDLPVAERLTLDLSVVARLEGSRFPSARRAINANAWALRALLGRRAISPSEVSAVLDVSGYAYGEGWGEGPIRSAAEYYEWLARRGAPAVLLPQQLGPFQRSGTAAAFRALARSCSLIFARDSVSYAAAADVLKTTSNLRSAPDITTLTPGVLPEKYQERGFPFQACIVPNSRMIDRTAPASGSAYTRFLVHCAEYLGSRGMRYCVLLHDTSPADVRLASEIAARVRPHPEILIESDPVHLKGMLGSCWLTISSRYHALVDSMSQGVPSIGAGWTHKYKTLFEDYGCSGCLVDLTDNESKWGEQLQVLLDERSRNQIAKGLVLAANARALKIHAMWQEVASVLRAKGSKVPSSA